MIPEGPLLWFLNRGSGFALLAVLSLAVLLGVLSKAGRAGGVVPGFVLQSLHRSISLLGVSLLTVHVLTAILDEFVDIVWWDALLPLGATYQPLWLGLGALSLDLILAVVVTSLLRPRVGYETWRVVHVLAYAAWSAGLVHGLGIGTDTAEPWAAAVYLGCVLVVGAAGLVRLAMFRMPETRHPSEVRR